MAEPKKHYRQLDVLLELTDEQLDAGRAAAHDFLTQQMTALGGVAPNAFVDNDRQAADYAAQHDAIAVSLLLNRALQIGLNVVLPEGWTVRDSYGRPLPEDYTPPENQ